MSGTSITDADEHYLKDVTAAVEDDEVFASFKSQTAVRGAVERLSASRGAEYREIVLQQTPDLLDHLDIFKTSDRIGAPETASYPEGEMSPTTWRYIKVLSDLRMLFGGMDGWNIAEIGVGYGGQCKILADLYEVESYTMYDLEPVMQLAEKFLRRVGSRAVGTLTLADFRRLGDGQSGIHDLVISNWALSECTKAVQDLYIDNVLRRSRRGYITYNQISHLRGIESYRKAEFIERLGFPVELMPEGLSGPVPAGMENFILQWSSQPGLA